MNSKIWIFFCIVFLMFNLISLFGDYYQVNYMIVEDDDKLYDDSVKFLLCVFPESIKSNNYKRNNFNYSASKIKGRNVSVSTYLNYSITSIEKFLNTSSLFKLNESIQFKINPCFLVAKKDLDKENPLDGFTNYYQIFIYALLKKQESIFTRLITPEIGFKPHKLKINKQIVYNQKYLLNPNCIKNEFKFEKNCFNECAKKIETEKYAFHDYKDDNLRTNLNHLFEFEKKGKEKKTKEEEKSLKGINETTNMQLSEKDYENFENCNKKCPKDFCTFESFSCYLNVETNQKEVKVKSSIFLAYYKVDYFWIQVIGLILFFTDNCLLNIIFRSILSTCRKLQIDRHQYFGHLFPKLKFFIIILAGLFIFLESLLMYLNYNSKLYYPDKTAFVNFSNEIPSIAACFPVNCLIDNSNLENQIVENLTFKEIESRTENASYKIIDYIRMKYVSEFKRNELNWKISNKVLFRNIAFNKSNHLSRCFKIELEYKKKLRYEMINPFYYLAIKFKGRHPHSLYLIDKDKNFASNLRKLRFQSFKKILKINSLTSEKSKCTDYKKLGLHCDSKESCIIQCINEKFYKKYTKLSSYSIIDKDKLNFNYSDITFDNNITKYKKIEENCTKIFKNYKDCKEVIFQESSKIKYNLDEILIKLSHETYYEFELEPSLVKILLSIMNLQCIFFGTNALSLLSWLCSIFIKRIKSKFIKFFIFLICGFGFCFHVVLVFRNIINEELVQSVHFENLKDNTQLPNMVICFEIAERIKKPMDINFKLTGHRLREETEELNFENLSLAYNYFNKTHWVSSKIYGSNFSSVDLSVRFFYFLNLKCVETEFKMPHFFMHNVIYSLHKTTGTLFFNEDIGFINFLLRKKGTYEFSNILRHNFKKISSNNTQNVLVNFEITELERYDHFEYLKNPRSLFYKTLNLNDPTTYLGNLKRNFKDLTNLTTRNIPLDDQEDYFNIEIDDELFSQFYMQVIICVLTTKVLILIYFIGSKRF